MSPDECRKRIPGAGGTRSVYLVDDDDELRRCLADALVGRGFAVAEFESGRRFLSAALSLPPGCVLADLCMDDGDGLELLRGLRKFGARLPVVMITGFADVSVAVQAMKLGAVDFIEKPFSINTIVDVVEAAFEHIPGGAEDEAALPGAGEARQRLATLTPRERDVLEGVVNGWTNRAIAQSLKISQRTVELHRAHLMDKLGARNVSQLVRLSLLASGKIAMVESTA